MNTRKAVTVCNFYIFAESELFMFTKRNRIRHGFEGIINRNDHVYQYRILNNADRDRIELELTLPIICQKNQMSTMLGYLIEVNLIYKDRGIFSINEEGAIKIKREIPCKYFSPTIETIEYAFWGLLTSANDFYDVIEAISKDNSIPDHEEVSSRIYYDVYQKNFLIQALETEGLLTYMSFSRPTYEEVVKDVDEAVKRLLEKDDESDGFDYLKDYGDEDN